MNPVNPVKFIEIPHEDFFKTPKDVIWFSDLHAAMSDVRKIKDLTDVTDETKNKINKFLDNRSSTWKIVYAVRWIFVELLGRCIFTSYNKNYESALKKLTVITNELIDERNDKARKIAEEMLKNAAQPSAPSIDEESQKKKAEEEAKKQAEEARKQAEDAKKQAEEAERQAEEARKQRELEQQELERLERKRAKQEERQQAYEAWVAKEEHYEDTKDSLTLDSKIPDDPAFSVWDKAHLIDHVNGLRDKNHFKDFQKLDQETVDYLLPLIQEYRTLREYTNQSDIHKNRRKELFELFKNHSYIKTSTKLNGKNGYSFEWDVILMELNAWKAINDPKAIGQVSHRLGADIIAELYRTNAAKREGVVDKAFKAMVDKNPDLSNAIDQLRKCVEVGSYKSLNAIGDKEIVAWINAKRKESLGSLKKYDISDEPTVNGMILVLQALNHTLPNPRVNIPYSGIPELFWDHTASCTKFEVEVINQRRQKKFDEVLVQILADEKKLKRCRTLFMRFKEVKGKSPELFGKHELFKFLPLSDTFGMVIDFDEIRKKLWPKPE